MYKDLRLKGEILKYSSRRGTITSTKGEKFYFQKKDCTEFAPKIGLQVSFVRVYSSKPKDNARRIILIKSAKGKKKGREATIQVSLKNFGKNYHLEMKEIFASLQKKEKEYEELIDRFTKERNELSKDIQNLKKRYEQCLKEIGNGNISKSSTTTTTEDQNELKQEEKSTTSTNNDAEIKKGKRKNSKRKMDESVFVGIIENKSTEYEKLPREKKGKKKEKKIENGKSRKGKQKKNMEELLAAGYISEALQSLSNPLKSPPHIVFGFFKSLLNGADLKIDEIDHIINMMKKSENRTKDKGVHITLKRDVITSLGKMLNTRNFKLVCGIVKKIFEISGNTGIGSVKNLNFDELIDLQCYMSTLLIACPLKSWKLMKSYSVIKEKLEKKEGEMTKMLTYQSNENFIPSQESEITTRKPKVKIEFDGPRKDLFVAPDAFDCYHIKEEAFKIIKDLKPSKEEQAKKKELTTQLENILNEMTPDFKWLVILYGSSASSYALKGSDVDICLKIKGISLSATRQGIELLENLQKCLQEKNTNLQCGKEGVIRSRVPILKITDTKRNLDCDICIDGYLGVVNTKMLETYSCIDERVPQLVSIVKNWAKKRDINSPKQGTLSSYSYVLLVIFYFQHLRLLPSLQKIVVENKIKKGNISQPHFVNAYDCKYYSNIKELEEIWVPKLSNYLLSLPNLIYGFFKFYSEFDFQHCCISIREGTPLKNAYGDMMNIEDPFEKRNLGLVLSDQGFSIIKQEFKRTLEILKRKGFLKEVNEKTDREELEVIHKFVKLKYSDYMNKDELKKQLKEGKLYTGELKVNKKKFRQAFVSIAGFDKDIFIDGFKNRNRALHGDIVIIKINEKDSNGQKTGTVVSIEEAKAPTYFACTLIDEKDHREIRARWLLPIDKVYPKFMANFDEFRNVFDTRASHIEDLIFVCEMIRPWKKSQHYPKGKLVGTIGLKKDLWAQKRSILLQNMPSLFQHCFKQTKNSSKVKPVTKAPKITDVRINPNDKEYKDYSKKCIFTIDPPTARDLDDAVSVEKLGSSYKIGVYIADVTKWIKNGDFNDSDGKDRGTSVYMIDSVEHMLNPSLSQNLCSLHAGVLRYSLAVEFILDQEGNLKQNSTEFSRVIMKSCCKLSYDNAQDVIMGKNLSSAVEVTNGYSAKDMKKRILMLNSLAILLRKKRGKRGSLFLNNQDIRFVTNKKRIPISYKKEEHNESHQLIEEFMLMANQLVAIELYKFDPKYCLLRSHEAPSDEKWKDVVKDIVMAYNKNIAKKGQEFELSVLLEKDLPSQEIMNNLFEKVKPYPLIYQTTQYSLLRTMNLAKYASNVSEDAFKHYALAAPFYTHFTSPIRRYADVVVHRMLLEFIEFKKTKKRKLISSEERDELNKLVDHINEQTFKAKTIQERCNKLYLSYYLPQKLRKGLVRKTAIVLSLGSRAFTVFIPDLCCDIQCNVMKDFYHQPYLITDEHSKEDQNKIESLTFLWKTKEKPRSLKLYQLKKIQVDLDVNYKSIPYDLVIFNIWNLKK